MSTATSLSPSLPSIALITPLPPPTGGMAVAAMALREHLEDAGASVLTIDTRAQQRSSPYSVGPRDISRFAAIYGTLYRHRHDFEVIHAHVNSYLSYLAIALPSIAAAKAFRKKVCITYHGGEAKTFFSGNAKHTLSLFAKADAITVPSPYLQDFFDSLGITARVIPNIVSLPSVERRPVAQRLLVNRILSPVYRIDVAIRALAALAETFPKITLAIAGDGPQRPELEALVRQLHIEDRVFFLGALDRLHMAREYARASLFVNPSGVDNTPNCVIEALLTGVPIVSTNVGGIPRMLTDGQDALLVAPDDVGEMTNALREVLGSPGTRKKLTRNAAVTATFWNPDNAWEQWQSLYREL